jgi:hypothetical protein
VVISQVYTDVIVDCAPSDVMEAMPRPSSGMAAAVWGGPLVMALFRGICLHLWSANRLTAEWHEDREGPSLPIHDEDGHHGTLHALPEPFRVLYRTIGTGLGLPVDPMPHPAEAEITS